LRSQSSHGPRCRLGDLHRSVTRPSQLAGLLNPILAAVDPEPTYALSVGTGTIAAKAAVGRARIRRQLAMGLLCIELLGPVYSNLPQRRPTRSVNPSASTPSVLLYLFLMTRSQFPSHYLLFRYLSLTGWSRPMKLQRNL
jgi:hypothetical protein